MRFLLLSLFPYGFNWSNQFLRISLTYDRLVDIFNDLSFSIGFGFKDVYIYIYIYIDELRTAAGPQGGKDVCNRVEEYVEA